MKTIHAIATGTLLGVLSAFAPGLCGQTLAPTSAPPSAPAAATPSIPAAAAPVAQTAMAGYDKVIYVQRLPSVEQLAATVPEGSILERVEVVSGQVAAFYRNATGAVTSVAYAQLAANGVASTPPVPAAPSPAQVPTANILPAPPPPEAAVPMPPPPPTYYAYPTTTYYYPTYSYPAATYYDYGSPYRYASPYPYLYPFGGIRLGIGIGFGGRGRR